MPLLTVEHLNIAFRQQGGWVTPVDDLSFEIGRNETLGVVGESGCGKSISAMAIGGLLPEETTRCKGRIVYRPENAAAVNCLDVGENELRKIRGRKIAYIFQEPSVCLNPVMRVGEQLREVFEIHFSEPCTDAALEAMLSDVGIPDPVKRLRCYPHELSGGMQQRIMIAMALAAAPDLLIADEPTTALDVTVQAQILRLLKTLRKKHNMSILLITHNFGLLAELADRVLVMYAGEIVESGSVHDVIRSPQHPYTRALLAAVPEVGSDNGRLQAIPGRVPLPAAYGSACRFRERCRFYPALDAAAQTRCDAHPSLEAVAPQHSVRCVNLSAFSEVEFEKTPTTSIL